MKLKLVVEDDFFENLNSGLSYFAMQINSNTHILNLKTMMFNPHGLESQIDELYNNSANADYYEKLVERMAGGGGGGDYIAFLEHKQRKWVESYVAHAGSNQNFLIITHMPLVYSYDNSVANTWREYGWLKNTFSGHKVYTFSGHTHTTDCFKPGDKLSTFDTIPDGMHFYNFGSLGGSWLHGPLESLLTPAPIQIDRSPAASYTLDFDNSGAVVRKMISQEPNAAIRLSLSTPRLTSWVNDLMPVVGSGWWGAKEFPVTPNDVGDFQWIAYTEKNNASIVVQLTACQYLDSKVTITPIVDGDMKASIHVERGESLSFAENANPGLLWRQIAAHNMKGTKNDTISGYSWGISNYYNQRNDPKEFENTYRTNPENSNGENIVSRGLNFNNALKSISPTTFVYKIPAHYLHAGKSTQFLVKASDDLSTHRQVISVKLGLEHQEKPNAWYPLEFSKANTNVTKVIDIDHKF